MHASDHRRAYVARTLFRLKKIRPNPAWWRRLMRRKHICSLRTVLGTALPTNAPRCVLFPNSDSIFREKIDDTHRCLFGTYMTAAQRRIQTSAYILTQRCQIAGGVFRRRLAGDHQRLAQRREDTIVAVTLRIRSTASFFLAKMTRAASVWPLVKAKLNDILFTSLDQSKRADVTE